MALYRARTYFRLAAVAAGLALLLAVTSALLRLPSDPGAIAAMSQALILTGLLFVPAAIFPAVVGAMFPSYWAATPVAVIRHSPLHRLLPALAAVLGYAVGASAAGLAWPATWLVALPYLMLVGIGAVLAVWVIGYSLALLDPRQVSLLISEYGQSRPENAERAVGDLCRLVRGMIRNERLEVAASMIEEVEALWRKHGARLDPTLTLRVLSECENKWPRRKRIAGAVRECRAAVEAELARRQ